MLKCADFAGECLIAEPCTTCRFYRPGNYARTGSCTLFTAYRGRGKLVYEFSDNIRLDSHKCGQEGRLWVAKKKENASCERQELLRSLIEDEE
jgi:hypothetical protein